jgi:hypothetical protein
MCGAYAIPITCDFSYFQEEKIQEVKFLFICCSQGGWENDETAKEAAVREAIEEAGVRGDLMVSFTSII